MKIRHSEPYGNLRSQEYPPVGEQLDALMKMAQSLQQQGVTLPEATQAWIAQCQAIKSRYAKQPSTSQPA